MLILAGGEATRLPGKLQLEAGDAPMIVRVFRKVRDDKLAVDQNLEGGGRLKVSGVVVEWVVEDQRQWLKRCLDNPRYLKARVLQIADASFRLPEAGA